VTKPIITACGDDCSSCPRYLANTEEELNKVAQLWYKIGWRDRIVSGIEINCNGCSIENNCRYKIIECVQKHKVEKCNLCEVYPCEKIKDMLEQTKQYKKKCKLICCDKDYKILNQAFFQKEDNIKK